MKKTKRLLAILGISMIAVSAFSLPASAANTSDTSYTFNFKTGLDKQTRAVEQSKMQAVHI